MTRMKIVIKNMFTPINTAKLKHITGQLLIIMTLKIPNEFKNSVYSINQH